MIEFIDLNNSCIRGYQLKAVLSILYPLDFTTLDFMTFRLFTQLHKILVKQRNSLDAFQVIENAKMFIG